MIVNKKITLREALWFEVNPPLKDLPQEKNPLRTLRLCGEKKSDNSVLLRLNKIKDFNLNL